MQTVKHLQGEADTTEILVGVIAHRGMDDHASWEFRTRPVMVYHHHVEPSLPSEGDFGRVVDAAVDGDEKTGTTVGDGLHRFPR